MDESVANQVEEEIISGLEGEQPDFNSLLETLDQLPKRKFSEVRAACAEKIAGKALESGDVEHWLAALSRADLVKEKEDQQRKETVDTVLEKVGKSPEVRSFIEHSGLSDDSESFSESVLRLSQLLKLKEGVLVYDRTWGSGVVSELDPFYGKITVDFDKKKFHELGMKYAAETLEILADDHLLSRLKNEPDVVENEINKEQGKIVRQALQSFGPMSVAVLQETVTNHLIPDSKWKKFWEGARRDLKKDPLVKIPTKRSEIIEIAESEEQYDEAWFAKLKVARRIPEIFEMLEALQENFEGELSDSAREAIGNRLAHVVKGSMNRPELEAQAMLYAFEFGGELPGFDTEKVKNDLLQQETLLRLFERMTVKDVSNLLEQLLKQDPELVAESLISLTPKLDASTLQTAFVLLEGTPSHDRMMASIKEQISQRETDPDLMLWLWRNRKRDDQNLIPLELLLDLTMISIEAVEEGTRLKAQNGLRELFRSPEWVKDLLGAMSEQDAKKLTMRVRESSAWPELDKRSVLGLMIKTRPELGSVMSSKTSDEIDEEDDEPAAAQITSQRSYDERQKTLNKIINEDIPNNSKEIAVARSYGDLRENFEYQSAKDTQGMLMKRQGELQMMLDKVMPTDFDGFPTDEAGPATKITLKFEDGTEESYSILGVWDQDEKLSIISSETKVAQAVDGKKPGESVSIPSESGVRNCTLISVEPLPEAVRQWIKTPVVAAQD